MWCRKIIKQCQIAKEKGVLEQEVEICQFYKCKSSIFINNVNIDLIVVSNDVLFGKKGFKCFKHFNGYECDSEIMNYALVYNVLKSECILYIEQILIKLNICLSW